MYFINEKAGGMSTNGKPVDFEKGLPILYRAQVADPNRNIVIWRDANKNIHVETTLNNVGQIIAAIRLFEKGYKYY